VKNLHPQQQPSLPLLLLLLQPPQDVELVVERIGTVAQLKNLVGQTKGIVILTINVGKVSFAE